MLLLTHFSLISNPKPGRPRRRWLPEHLASVLGKCCRLVDVSSNSNVKTRRREWLTTPVFLQNSMDRGPWQAPVYESERVKQGLATHTQTRRKPGFPGGSDGKELGCRAGHPVSTLGSGRSPGEGNGYPSQYSCLKNSIIRGVWRATVDGVLQDATQLRD